MSKTRKLLLLTSIILIIYSISLVIGMNIVKHSRSNVKAYNQNQVGTK